MFFAFPPPLVHALDVLDRLDRAWQTWSRRVPRRPVSIDGSRTDPQIDHVVDPDGSTRLVRVAGVVTPATVPSLVQNWCDVVAPVLVHIDLTDAVIADLTTMVAFERALDHLERHGVDIRIVGLDPAHPALMA